MSYNPSERKDVRKAEKLAAIAEAARVSYTKRIMSEVEGRQWMHDLLLRCHVFSTPFVRGAPDLTSFNCGEQNIGYQTFKDVVNYCPNEYVIMMQEANLKELTNGRRPNTDDRTPAGELSGRPEPGRIVEGTDIDPAVWRPEDADEFGQIPIADE